ncbi:MAG: HAMP domain-containing protein [Clostridia bacterium]|nr:HAMP domain-containing protein [Clostridia bacterium]
MSLMLSFVNESLKMDAVSEIKVNMLSQGSIIADQVENVFEGISNEYTYQYLENLVKRQSLEINSRVLLLNLDGIVVLDTHDELEGKNYTHILEIEDALQGASLSELYKIASSGENVLYTAIPIFDRDGVIGVVFISTSADHIFDKINRTLRSLMILSLIGLIITGVIGFAFADILSSPIENITDYVRDITKGVHDQRIQVVGNDEIANLCNAFNSMAAKLDQVDDQRRMFVSNVSHELRTPMASVKILCESLLASEHWEEGVYREFLGDINDEVNRLNNLIDSLLYLVNLEKKELEINYEVTYVNYLVLNVIKRLKPLASKKHLELKFHAHEKIQMDADREKIQQCLFNIIGNAIKYTPERGMIDVYLSMDKVGNVIIKVQDTGIGIPKDRIEHVFDRFYRVDEARARKTGGNGLGLSIAQQIIHLHQGTISLESEVDQGTTFTIQLPQKMII